ncbi:MAG: acyl-CoA dehydrogenase family protein, partial [Nakamurella sp.]
MADSANIDVRNLGEAALGEHYLPDGLVDRFRERAAVCDRENRFCHEDLEELTACGYSTVFVPAEFGGPGLSLNQVARLQQRLAGASPSTALAINMHLMTLGVVRMMSERGDHSLDYVFDEAMAGEIFAFGVSEPGNDWVLQGSNTAATVQSDGSYLLTGVKIFTSLSPVWTRLLVHGLDDADPDKPLVVYGFIDRSDAVKAGGSWDVLGMRATESRVTVLTDAPLRADRIARKIPAGRTPDLLTFAITANFQLLIASVYAGIGRRALELAAAGLKSKSSAKYGTRYAEVPEYRVRVADALRDYLPVTAQIDCYTRDVDDLVDHGSGWPLRLISARIAASVSARRLTETALLCAGGSSYSNGSELSRLYRDAAASLFHPASAD